MATRSLLANSKIANYNFIRYKTRFSGGIKYHGFTYYPRFPDEKDPPYEPTKLLMVQRIKPLKGTPFWDKKILKELKLDGKTNEVAVVKNIPEVNAKLWQIKHLIKILPITCPNGLPEEGDYNGTYLTEYGEFQVSPRLKVENERIEATEKFLNDRSVLDKDSLGRYLRLKWLQGW